jgi:tetratricopeptide (TPR) repeat protein
MVQSFNVSFARIGRTLLLFAVCLVAGCGSPEDRAQSYYERGMKLLSQQDYVKASIEFRNALQLKKDLVGAWRGLAQIEDSNQNLESLFAILRTVVELDPNDIDARVRLARLLVAGNAFDEALNMINAAAELDNKNARVLGNKAVILWKLNDSLGAVRQARAALELNPANAEAIAVLAVDRLARGDAEGALMILDREQAASTKDIGLQLFKIKVLEQLGNQEQVEAAFRKLIELYPQEPAFRKLLVKHYLDQKRPDDAEKELRALAAANPTDVEAGLNIIRFVRAIKGFAEARQELVNRINAGGQVFPYQMALAEFDFAQGDVTNGVQLLEKLAQSADNRANALAAQVKLAEIHLSRKKYDAAEALVTEILRKDNRNTSGLRLRAALRLEHGQLDAAIADAREALNDQPRSTDLMLLLAVIYERSGSIELAEKQYADATQVSNFDAAVALKYVAFLIRRGSTERAEDILTELTSRWPSNISVLSALADVRLSRQNWIGAQEIAERIRRIGDDRGRADLILGAALSARNKYDESISVLQNAYTAAPGAAQPMVTLVNTLVRAGKLDQAAAFLQTVLQENPGNAEAHVLLGSVQLMQNVPEQALKSFRTAIERQPKNMAGYRALADLHLREKNNDAALEVIRAGLKERPDSFDMHLALASLLQLKGDYEAAIAEYEYMLKQDSGSLIVANNLASMLSDHRTDKASLERAYSLATMLRKSQVPSFKDTLGWVYYQRGDHKNAISLLEEAAAELPERPLVRYHLGMSYVANGQAAKASEQLKKALELAPSSDLQVKIRNAQEKIASN